MTKAEAIFVLEHIEAHNGLAKEAKLMAIDALKQPTLTTAGESLFVTGMSIAKGKWSHPKRIHNVKHSIVWQCSICGRTCHCIGGAPRGETNICTYKYCPNCGSEMEIADD